MRLAVLRRYANLTAMLAVLAIAGPPPAGADGVPPVGTVRVDEGTPALPDVRQLGAVYGEIAAAIPAVQSSRAPEEAPPGFKAQREAMQVAVAAAFDGKAAETEIGRAVTGVPASAFADPGLKAALEHWQGVESELAGKSAQEVAAYAAAHRSQSDPAVRARLARAMALPYLRAVNAAAVQLLGDMVNRVVDQGYGDIADLSDDELGKAAASLATQIEAGDAQAERRQAARDMGVVALEDMLSTLSAAELAALDRFYGDPAVAGAVKALVDAYRTRAIADSSRALVGFIKNNPQKKGG